jgi:hypothetical protein
MGTKLGLSVLSNMGGAGNGSNVTIGEGGLYQYLVHGTFSGTTAKLQTLGPDGTNFIDVPNSSMSAAGALNVELPSGSIVRGVLTSGTPTAMYASLGFVR